MLRPLNLFYGYHTDDESFLEGMEKHLSSLEQAGLATAWSARQISPGADREGTINRELESADIILLLISADFLDSPACQEVTRRGLLRHKSGQAIVVPVLVRHAAWEDSPLAELQPVPPNRLPIKNWSDRDEAWLEVQRRIRALIQLRQKGKLAQVSVAPAGPTEVAAGLGASMASTLSEIEKESGPRRTAETAALQIASRLKTSSQSTPIACIEKDQHVDWHLEPILEGHALRITGQRFLIAITEDGILHSDRRTDRLRLRNRGTEHVVYKCRSSRSVVNIHIAAGTKTGDVTILDLGNGTELAIPGIAPGSISVLAARSGALEQFLVVHFIS